MQKISVVLFFFIFLNSSFAKEKLVVGTYDSFSADWGPGPIIEEKFEEICNCDLQFISTSQAGTLNNEIFLNGKDVILGVEMHEFNYSIEDWHEYDHGFFSFIYDSSKLTNPPKTFEELVNREDLKIVVQDPRTSPVGIGLLRWMKSIFKDDFSIKLKQLDQNIITYSPGWSEAYGIFLEGNADLVLSYSTSPFYHQEYENEYKYKSLNFTEGHLATREIVYVREESMNQKLAKKFIDFIIEDEIQKIISSMNIMYPSVDKTELVPEKMKNLIKPKEIDYKVFLESEPLIETWLETIAG